jgi:hypothetical protein
MSSAITTAIYRRLTGLEVLTGAGLAAQQALAAMLGTDPDTVLPAVHKGNKSNVVVYPAITFRQNTGMVNTNFKDTAIDDVYYDFEIWDNTQRGNILTDIYTQFEHLLDQRFAQSLAIPALSVDSAQGQLYYARAFVPMTELYDKDLRSWFGLCRMRFVEARF